MTVIGLGMGLPAASIRSGNPDEGDGPPPTPAPSFIGAISDIAYTAGEAITPVDVSAEFSGTITSFAAVGAWPAGIGIGAGDGIISGTSAVEGVAAGLQIEAIGPGGSALSNVLSATGAAPAAQTRNFLTFGGSQYASTPLTKSPGTPFNIKFKCAFTTEIRYGRMVTLVTGIDFAKSIQFSQDYDQDRLELYVEGTSYYSEYGMGASNGAHHAYEIDYADGVFTVLMNGVTVITAAVTTQHTTDTLHLALNAGGTVYLPCTIADVTVDNNGTVTEVELSSGSTVAEVPSDSVDLSEATGTYDKLLSTNLHINDTFQLVAGESYLLSFDVVNNDSYPGIYIEDVSIDNIPNNYSGTIEVAYTALVTGYHTLSIHGNAAVATISKISMKGSALTFVNVAPGHWEEFTLSGNEWLSADYAGDMYGNGGTAVDDTDFFKLGEGDYQIKNVSGGVRYKFLDIPALEGARFKWSINFYELGGIGKCAFRVGTVNLINALSPIEASGYTVRVGGNNGMVQNNISTVGAENWVKFKDVSLRRALEIAS